MAPKPTDTGRLHRYPEPDPGEGYLDIREMEDHELVTETQFLAGYFHATLAELARFARDEKTVLTTGGMGDER